MQTLWRQSQDQNPNLLIPNHKILYTKVGGCFPWDRDVFLVLFLSDIVSYIGSIWRFILPLLRLAQEENDMLAICHGKGQEDQGNA